MTSLRALLLALLASGAMACSDPVEPVEPISECPEFGLDCPLPDFTGDWEAMLSPPGSAGGSCQFEPIAFQLERTGVLGVRGAFEYGGEHSGIEGTCDEAGWAALGITKGGPGRLLSSGTIAGSIGWGSRSSCSVGFFGGCGTTQTNGLEISLTLEGTCGDHPLCDGSARVVLRGDVDWPNNGTLGGLVSTGIPLRSTTTGNEIIAFLTETWTATRKGG